MQKRKSFNKGKFSIKTAIKEYSDIIKNLNIKVSAAVVAAILLLTSFGVVTKYYTLAYDVYYGDVNVGVTASKSEAIKLYNEAKTDVGECSGKGLKHRLTFVMTVAPVEKMLESDIYRGIVEAAEGKESCYGIVVNDTVITKVKTQEDAEYAIEIYRSSFNREDAVIHTDYTVELGKDIVTSIKTASDAAEDIKASGMMVVSYSDVIKADIEISYNEIYVDDDSIPKGTTVCYQEGVLGSGVSKITYYENGLNRQAKGPFVEVVLPAEDRIIHVGTGDFTGLEKNSLPWPAEGTFSSPFGYRWGKNHNGIDIAAPLGTPIYAPAGGTVTFAGIKNGYGNYVSVDHGNGYVTTYAHMNEVYVKEGDVLSKGAMIGAVGRTGRATGNHLHFEVLVNGSFVNPMDYIEG